MLCAAAAYEPITTVLPEDTGCTNESACWCACAWRCTVCFNVFRHPVRIQHYPLFSTHCVSLAVSKTHRNSATGSRPLVFVRVPGGHKEVNSQKKKFKGLNGVLWYNCWLSLHILDSCRKSHIKRLRRRANGWENVRDTTSSKKHARRKNCILTYLPIVRSLVVKYNVITPRAVINKPAAARTKPS